MGRPARTREPPATSSSARPGLVLGWSRGSPYVRVVEQRVAQQRAVEEEHVLAAELRILRLVLELRWRRIVRVVRNHHACLAAGASARVDAAVLLRVAVGRARINLALSICVVRDQRHRKRNDRTRSESAASGWRISRQRCTGNVSL